LLFSNIDFALAIGDKVYANNLWLIIEIESDDRGLRCKYLFEERERERVRVRERERERN
jgi:hypothetical protein